MTTTAARILFRSLQLVEAEANKSIGRGETRKLMSILSELTMRLPRTDLIGADKQAVQAAGRAIMATGRPPEQMKLLQRGLMSLYDAAKHLKLTTNHPLRGPAPAHSGPMTSTLLVNLEADLADQVAAAVSLQPAETEREPSARTAMEMVRWYPFRRIICGYPLEAPGIQSLLDRVRLSKSPTQTAGLVLFCSDEDEEGAGQFVGRGCNWVLNKHSVPDLGAVFAWLDNISPRVDLKVPLLISDTGSGLVETAMWQTQNISETGILVRTRARLELGCNFGCEFSLPGGVRPVKVRAEVTRKTITRRDQFEGLAARFVQFDGDARERIRAYIANHLADS